MPINANAFQFNDYMIGGAPELAGVYALYQGNELIYYGRAQGGSTTIRSRLRSHKSGTEGRGTQQATHYAWEVCLNPVSREVELLEEYRRVFARLPRCNERVG